MSQYQTPKKETSKSTISSHPTKTASTQVHDDDVIRESLQRQMVNPQTIMALQRTYGNQAVQRILVDSVTISQKNGAKIQRWNPFQGFARSNIFGSKGNRQDVPAYATQTGDKSMIANVNENVRIPSTDNVVLSGRFYTSADPTQGPSAGKTILFLSGSGGSAEKYGYNVAREYCRKGANVLTANYRGFGDSKKETTDKHGVVKRKNIDPSQEGLYQDARAMFNWLGAQGIAANDVIVHGFSLGGSIAANLVAELANDPNGRIDVAGLVMHSPMESAASAAKDVTGDMGLGRGLGKFIAGLANSPLTTEDKFQQLAAINPNLPLFFMSGDYNGGNGDQLDISHTGIDQMAIQAGMTDVTSKRSTSTDHEGTRDHMLDVAGGVGGLDNWLGAL